MRSSISSLEVSEVTGDVPSVPEVELVSLSPSISSWRRMNFPSKARYNFSGSNGMRARYTKLPMPYLIEMCQSI